jgi:predicted NAD/FAD-dependent oxidoreductase
MGGRLAVTRPVTDEQLLMAQFREALRRATAAATYNEIIGLLRPFISHADPQVKHWVWNSAEWLDWLTHNSDRFLKP